MLESPEGKSRFPHQGLRVMEGLRLMQAASDYYVRQFRDMKVSPDLNLQTLHSRSIRDHVWLGLRAGSCKGGDAAMIAGHLGSKESFDEALVKYAPT